MAYYPPTPRRRSITQISSFIFLHDKDSSSTQLAEQVARALNPKSIADTLGPRTKMLFLDAPIQTSVHPVSLPTPLPPHQEQQQETQGEEEEEQQQQQYTWFSTTTTTTHSVGADDDAATSWKELSISLTQLDEAVTQESERFGKENVFLVGVGMGFAVAAAYVMQMEERIGGLLGVSGWLAFHEEVKSVAVYGDVSSCGLLSGGELEDGAKGNEEEGDEDDVLGSGYSTPTLCEEESHDQAQSSSLLLKRAKAFLSYILLRGKPPALPRLCNLIDASTPVLLVHGAENQRVRFTHAKEAQETLRHFGFEVTLRVLEGETHELSRRLMGELMDGFMGRGLGNEDVRGSVGEMLLGGWL
ncbi:hypothetical protein BBK36DRAFT_1116364 [Trichoderma citrinoviride]|uniref:Phospholipase/carboxylesterase/thioesterase domain-containing protein n=1 Tax=Trichoderma citrinoviride TaxID=58853 RepID=A0A2T4BD37_9HYPO|nr:hypothetical protein BBK36DRAFT_1116364 [Trichoderma citrinoviride]PTB67247.1 hypothetical protein BBK36DRAFT_1116364 [Trichoderma citrinoviride]